MFLAFLSKNEISFHLTLKWPIDLEDDLKLLK